MENLRACTRTLFHTRLFLSPGLGFATSEVTAYTGVAID